MPVKESKVTRKATSRARKAEPARRKGPAQRAPDQEKAIQEFEAALKWFHKQDYARAREQFEAIVEKYPREREILDRARTYLRAADRAQQPPVPRLKDAEDHYNQGVFHLNRQELDEAIRLFDKALSLDAGADRALYGRSCALALAGRPEEALEALRKAIEANPANRVRAANDRDFDALRDAPAFTALVSVTVSEEEFPE